MTRATLQLQGLYGADVLPDDLIGENGVNGNLARLECLRKHEGRQDDGLSEVWRLLQRHCLPVEEKPIITRFHLFAGCVYCLLRWKLLGLPVEKLLRTGTTSPMPRNQRRLEAVTAYFSAGETSVSLRRAALCLQLTMYATNLTGQKAACRQPTTSTEFFARGAADATEPTLVKLARGHVGRRVWERLAEIMGWGGGGGGLAHDPTLRGHESHVLECLAATAGELQVRFRQYETWPARVVLLSKRFNPRGCVAEALGLLAAAPGMLDRGFSLRLRERALQAGPSDAQQLDFLLSTAVQAEIDAIALHVEGSSLDVERKHQQDKMCESHKVLGVAAASRNGIIRQWRRDVSLARAQGQGEDCSNRTPAKNTRRARFTNLRSLALSKAPHLFPQAKGCLWWQAGTCRQEARTLREARSSEDLTRLLQEYIESNKTALEKELSHLRSAAAPAQEACHAGGAPLSKAKWLEWLHEDSNRSAFLQRVRESRAGSRRCHNVRLKASEMLPREVGRLQAETVAQPLPCWQRLQSGFFCLRDGLSEAERDPEQVVLLVISAGRQNWGLPLEQDASGGGFISPLRGLSSQPPTVALRPLREVLPDSLQQKECEVYKIDMKVVLVAEDSHCILKVSGARTIPVPTRQRRSSAERASGLTSEDEEGSSSDDSLSEVPTEDASEVPSLVSTDEDSVSGGSRENTDNDAPAAKVDVVHGDGSGDSDGLSEAVTLPRMAAHSHTAWQNEYFVVAFVFSSHGPRNSKQTQ